MWDGVIWNGVMWEGVMWEDVMWEGVMWEGVKSTVNILVNENMTNSYCIYHSPLVSFPK